MKPYKNVAHFNNNNQKIKLYVAYSIELCKFVYNIVEFIN